MVVFGSKITAPQAAAEGEAVVLGEDGKVPESMVPIYTLPIGGDAIGGVKNGGNVTINADGTMDAEASGGGGGNVTMTIERVEGLTLNLTSERVNTHDFTMFVGNLTGTDTGTGGSFISNINFLKNKGSLGTCACSGYGTISGRTSSKFGFTKLQYTSGNTIDITNTEGTSYPILVSSGGDGFSGTFIYFDLNN